MQKFRPKKKTLIPVIMLLNPCGQPKKRKFLQSFKFVALRLLNDTYRDFQRVDSVVVFINLNSNVNVNYVNNFEFQCQCQFRCQFRFSNAGTAFFSHEVNSRCRGGNLEKQFAVAEQSSQSQGSVYILRN